jgi:DUF2075 family protein
MAACGLLTARQKSVENWVLIFEYELPRERGRRPDVVVLGPGWVLALEFKDYSIALAEHLDQAAAYARDLHSYHSQCADLSVVPFLVLTKSVEPRRKDGDVWVTGAAELAEVIEDVVGQLPSRAQIEPTTWLNGDYLPLPSLVNAARLIFEHEPLPQIRRALSAGIPQTIRALVETAKTARARGERHLALVTGVPGAGKTLVGLQFVYENHFGEKTPENNAVFLSGNGPLVKVLQHALRSSVFVQDVHGFLRQYGGNSLRRPIEHIWVYDEAQRAWDAQRVGDKRGHATSEPEDFLKIGCRIERWATMIGLIGEGQEIHLGEEAGLGQWNDAIRVAGERWIVHCPPKLTHVFTAAAKIHADRSLDLSQSLRSHLAEDVQNWVGAVLSGRMEDARSLADNVHSQGFAIYVTRDLERAKAYVRERYAGQADKRFGLLASSKGKNLPAYGVRNDYNFTRNMREGPWYNDVPDSRFSCCQLTEVATEFACQGLELDMPIVCWGSDLTWADSRWRSLPQTRSTAKNPHQLRINSYRVLLSRGRDGLIIFVPADDIGTPTAEALVTSGARRLA